MASKAAIQQRDSAREALRHSLPPGTELKTILRHVSRSGMMRHVSVTHLGDDLTYLVSRALLEHRADNGGIKVAGCGTDAGFELTYNLGSALYPRGFTCVGDRCPSNDHSNGDRDYTPHHHTSGGYAFSQRWL